MIRRKQKSHTEIFEEVWKPLVTNHNGNLDQDKIARELADYHDVMEEVSKVYVEITGGLFSKPNTAAAHVIAVTELTYAREYAHRLVDAIHEPSKGLTIEQLKNIVHDWYPAAWEELEDDKNLNGNQP